MISRMNRSANCMNSWWNPPNPKDSLTYKRTGSEAAGQRAVLGQKEDKNKQHMTMMNLNL